jgi:hypothetical protein
MRFFKFSVWENEVVRIFRGEESGLVFVPRNNCEVTNKMDQVLEKAMLGDV